MGYLVAAERWAGETQKATVVTSRISRAVISIRAIGSPVR